MSCAHNATAACIACRPPRATTIHDRSPDAQPRERPDGCDCWGTGTCDHCDPTGEIERARHAERRTADAQTKKSCDRRPPLPCEWRRPSLCDTHGRETASATVAAKPHCDAHPSLAHGCGSCFTAWNAWKNCAPATAERPLTWGDLVTVRRIEGEIVNVTDAEYGIAIDKETTVYVPRRLVERRRASAPAAQPDQNLEQLRGSVEEAIDELNIDLPNQARDTLVIAVERLDASAAAPRSSNASAVGWCQGDGGCETAATSCCNCHRLVRRQELATGSAQATLGTCIKWVSDNCGTMNGNRMARELAAPCASGPQTSGEGEASRASSSAEATLPTTTPARGPEEAGTSSAASLKASVDPVATINDMLHIGGAVLHVGKQLKCYVPDDGGGVSKTYLDADECSMLADAFAALAAKFTDGRAGTEVITRKDPG